MSLWQYPSSAGFPSGRVFFDSIELALSATLMQAHSTRVEKMRTYKNGLTPLRLRKVTELIGENLHLDLSAAVSRFRRPQRVPLLTYVPHVDGGQVRINTFLRRE